MAFLNNVVIKLQKTGIKKKSWIQGKEKTGLN
jgi:hypothetical protein